MASILGGCEAPPQVTDHGEHGVSTLQFPDVPVPDGLELLEDPGLTNSHVSGTTYRYADFTYSGKVPVDEVSTYVLERWPQHSWTLVGREGAERDQTLHFRRGIYEASCEIERLENATTRLIVHYRTEIRPLASRAKE